MSTINVRTQTTRSLAATPANVPTSPLSSQAKPVTRAMNTTPVNPVATANANWQTQRAQSAKLGTATTTSTNPPATNTTGTNTATADWAVGGPQPLPALGQPRTRPDRISILGMPVKPAGGQVTLPPTRRVTNPLINGIAISPQTPATNPNITQPLPAIPGGGVTPQTGVKVNYGDESGNDTFIPQQNGSVLITSPNAGSAVVDKLPGQINIIKTGAGRDTVAIDPNNNPGNAERTQMNIDGVMQDVVVVYDENRTVTAAIVTDSEDQVFVKQAVNVPTQPVNTPTRPPRPIPPNTRPPVRPTVPAPTPVAAPTPIPAPTPAPTNNVQIGNVVKINYDDTQTDVIRVGDQGQVSIGPNGQEITVPAGPDETLLIASGQGQDVITTEANSQGVRAELQQWNINGIGDLVNVIAIFDLLGKVVAAIIYDADDVIDLPGIRQNVNNQTTTQDQNTIRPRVEPGQGGLW